MKLSSSPLAFVDPNGELVSAILKAAQPHAKGTGDATFCAALGAARPQLAALVEWVFWASTAVEEGRPVRGVVALCPASEPGGCRFDGLQQLTVSRLVQLMTALPEAVLGVTVANGDVWLPGGIYTRCPIGAPPSRS
jgi:hypothetical protein